MLPILHKSTSSQIDYCNLPTLTLSALRNLFSHFIDVEAEVERG